jgi:hypothetical protein
VFEATFGNGSSTAGWCKLGTYAGNSQARFYMTIVGKAGWNDQNYPSQAFIHGGTNYIASDTGQIAAGCKWLESLGSEFTADAIMLVRQAGYDPWRFDIYILRDVNYVNWTIEFTSVTDSFTPDVQFQQTGPGSGTNTFAPDRIFIYDTGNLINPVRGTGSTGYIPKFTGTSTIGNSIIQDNGSTVSIGGALTASSMSTNSLTVGNISNTEFSYLATVSANIQTQLNQLAQVAVSGSGAGTPNRITKFITADSMGDSTITDNGTNVVISGVTDFEVTGSAQCPIKVKSTTTGGGVSLLSGITLPSFLMFPSIITAYKTL